MNVGKCFTIEALVKFFNMANKDGNPTNNRPPLFHILMMGNNKQVYFNSVLDKIIDEFQPHSQVLLEKTRTKRMRLSPWTTQTLLTITPHAS